jgi:exodeoxyribonuclease VII large subunit
VTPKAPSSSQPSSPQLDLLFDVTRAEEPGTATPPRRSRIRERRTWLVHQLVAEARDLVETELGDVWVEGEISNLRPASSGHLYFTLKDAEAQLPVVLFRRQAMLLRFRPEDGLHVRVRGKVSVYEQRGQLQLVAETVEPVGAGSLQLAFEQLRDRLKAEGLFDQERKRQLPAFPRTVAIITSPTGAVIRDFLNIVNRRHSGLSVLVIPAAVQGDSAPAEIEAAIVHANDLNPSLNSLDLIVLARGGGSLEDLAAFNSERVARAIVNSRLPVVSAIGHETDFTIADFVSDLRAPTPSAAAELITEAQHKVEELVAALSNRLIRAARFQLLQARQRLGRVPISYAEQRLTTTLHRLEQRLDDLSFRMESAMSETLHRRHRALADLAAAVLRHDPRQQLSTAREALAASQSRLNHALDRSLASARHRNQSLEARLFRAAQVAVANRRAAYGAARNQLQSLSPLAVLQRGYALVQDESGAVVRSVERLTTNQSVSTRLGDGTFSSQITAIESSKRPKKKKERSPSQ